MNFYDRFYNLSVKICQYQYLMNTTFTIVIMLSVIKLCIIFLSVTRLNVLTLSIKTFSTMTHAYKAYLQHSA
jgi:hypothetical protein